MKTSFEKMSFRLNYRENWKELALRPNPEECDERDEDLLSKEIDDLKELSKRCLEARKELNCNLPPHELVLDHLLEIKNSTILNAGKGLFYMPPKKMLSSSFITNGKTICYYTGHRHNFYSQKFLIDRSYLLNVSGDILVDPQPVLSIKARFINDPLNEAVVNCKFVPDPSEFRCAVVATRDIRAGEELFVSYGEIYWSQQNYDGTVHCVSG